MEIIICGAGEVGRHCAEVMTSGNSITIIDLDEAKLAQLDETLDARTLVGNATHAETLLEAGVASADLFIAVTNVDENNLLSASVASGLGAHRTIARVHHSAYFDSRGLDYSLQLGIDHLVCPDHTTAVAIAQVLRSPGAIAVERFARGKVELQQLPVSDDAQAVGQPLSALKMPGSARIVAIERQNIAFIPEASTVIQPDDVVTLVGESAQFDKIKKLFHTAEDRRQRVMINGGTALAVWLCRALHSRNFSVRLFEPDPRRAEELAEKLGWVTVLNVNPIEGDVLKEERIDQADAFVATTHDDESNILAAAQAKRMGAQTAIAVLQRGTYLHLIEHVGIDRAFSPRSTAVTQIQRLLDDSPVRHLATLAEGIAEVFEVRATSEAKDVINQPLRQVKFPARTIIAAIQRDESAFVPGAADDIRPGDTVVVIAPAGTRKVIRKLFVV